MDDLRNGDPVSAPSAVAAGGDNPDLKDRHTAKLDSQHEEFVERKFHLRSIT